MKPEVQRFLGSVWNVLKNPNRWIQGAYAAGSTKADSLPERMCILGACQAVQKRDGVDALTVGLAINEIKRNLPSAFMGNIPHFNDWETTDHKALSKLFASVLEGAVQVEHHGVLRIERAIPQALAIEDLTTDAPD